MNYEAYKMTIAELPEAVAAYLQTDGTYEQNSGLMELLQRQTDYYQKRFWKMADQKKEQLERAQARRDNQMIQELVRQINA